MILLLSFALAWGTPLQLDTVLISVERVPLVTIADANVDEATAKVMEKQGAFDPALIGKLSSYGGKYPRSTVTTGLAADTLWGPSVAVGYARGVGDFPAYAGDAETGPSGELWGSVEVPLLDGLGFGKQRAALGMARVGVEQKQAARADVMRKVRLEASKRYWAWHAAGASLKVTEAQLELAERRAFGLARQVELGQKPELDRLDNERVLQERHAKVADAQRKLRLAAIDLSLFLRDQNGDPRVPTHHELPEVWAPPAPLPDTLPSPATLARPDRQKAEAEIALAELALRQARNGVLPKLNLVGGATRPLDEDWKPELMAGVSLEAPLALRQGRGTRDAAQASAAAAYASQRAVDDLIHAEITGAWEARRLAEIRVLSLREAVKRTAEVLDMERRRQELGAGDLFQLLLREDALARSAEALIEAEYHLRLTDAALAAATADVEDR